MPEVPRVDPHDLAHRPPVCDPVRLLALTLPEGSVIGRLGWVRFAQSGRPAPDWLCFVIRRQDWVRLGESGWLVLDWVRFVIRWLGWE